MPKFLEDKLKKEYGADSKIPYKVMNKIGAMRGNRETPKGRAMEAKHAADVARGKGKVGGRSRAHGNAASDHAPAGFGSLSRRPRVISNPKTLAGRRDAAHAKAYSD